MKRFASIIFAALLMVPFSLSAATMEELEKRVAELEEKLQNAQDEEDESAWSWLEIGGDFRARGDYLDGTVHEHFNFPKFQQGLFDEYTNRVNTAIVTGNPVDLSVNPTQAAALMANGMIPENDVKNENVFTNRLGLNIKARATENVQVKTRLLMYKVWAHQSTEIIAPQQIDAFGSDRVTTASPFDGQVAHIPGDSALYVDYAYITWSNIADLPMWFSIGRRPSTGGLPRNYAQNREKVGTAGTPGSMIDYAFDGVSFGYAPYIDALPGAYVKLCWGRGFDSGFEDSNKSTGIQNLDDTDFVGANVVPYNEDLIRVELQYDRALNIFDNFPDSGVKANLGDIDQYGIVVSSKLEDVGPGTLNLFGTATVSQTHPTNDTFKTDILDISTGTLVVIPDQPLAGLLYDAGQTPKSRTGESIYIGGRYDLEDYGTKLGLEYNYGSKNWIAFTPASDDLWTGKLGTRGHVYEAYVIQELPGLAIAKNGNAFFRLGVQYYDFEYTGSNDWRGEPKKISDLSKSDPSLAQFLSPLDTATDVYLTFEATF